MRCRVSEPIVYKCKRHPNIETSLRCSKCEDPICPKCAILSAVGYRCPSCGKERSVTLEVPLGLLVIGSTAGFGLGFLASWLIGGSLGFFVLFLAAIVGGAVGEIMVRLVKRRKSLVVSVFTAIGFFAGAFFDPIRVAIRMDISNSEQIIRVLFSNPWGLAFAFLASLVAWQRIRW